MKTEFMGGSLSFKGDKKAKKKKKKTKHKKEKVTEEKISSSFPDEEDEDLTPAERKARYNQSAWRPVARIPRFGLYLLGALQR